LGLFPDDRSPAVPDDHIGTRCRSLAPLRLQPGQAVRRDKGGFGHAGLSGYIKDKAVEVGRVIEKRMDLTASCRSNDQSGPLPKRRARVARFLWSYV
jgi:hypothetical protein